MSEDMLTIWIADRNLLQYQLRTAEEQSIRAALEIKLDRVNAKIDAVLAERDD